MPNKLLTACLFTSLISCAALSSAIAQTADVVVVNKIKTNGNLPGNLAFMNLASGKILSHVPVGKEPHEVAVSPDGKYAVVSDTGSYQQPGNTLSVFDVAKQKEIHRVDLGPLWNPHGLLASGGLFYFTAEGARSIGAYDPVQNKLVWVMGTGQDSTHMLAATKDGKTIVATNRGSATISIFELKGTDPLLAGAWKETIVAVGQGPEGLDISPDGTQVWVGCRGENGITIVDLVQKKVIATPATQTRALARVKFTIDGKYLLATDPSNGNLLFIDTNSQQVLKTLHIGQWSEAIFNEPDGKHVLIGITGEDSIAEVDLQSMSVVRRIAAGQGPDQMAWIGR